LRIAITGLAFRFPGDLSDEDGFWAALVEQQDLISVVPADRWAVEELAHPRRREAGHSITFAAGVLSRIEEFDAGFFGISPREARALDPQQRLLLELAWEAMENAGTPPSTLAGTNCAVYVGISGLDYGTRILDDLAAVSPHSMTGNTLSITANRLSYVFDLHGPSIAVDTACSSSIVALHQACNSLRTGDATTALVGGVNLLLHPYPFIGFTKASMLSANGRCRAFDAAADGYVRSEGGAVLLLKPFERAVADGDDIHAVILATGSNSDGGRKTGITIPSRDGQVELMRAVLERSGISAAHVDFIEAHGTGTIVGDPIEAAAIGEVYGRGRQRPLPIGSVKANLGHLEAASGFAGLVKTILALKNRSLPPMLHLETPNPAIDFAKLNLALPTRPRRLAAPGRKRLLVAGVNSFGFGGTNAHVLIQEAPRPATEGEDTDPGRTTPVPGGPLPPLLISARTEEALRALAGRYADLVETASDERFYDVAFAAAFHRERLERRLVLRADSVAQAVRSLRRVETGESPEDVITEDAPSDPGKIAFVFSGNGAQWAGMGRALLEGSPRFAAIIDEIDVAMHEAAGFSLRSELNHPEAASRLADTAIAQPLLFALQVAITRVLSEAGIEPAAVVGHSVGEVAAAWAAGALDLDQAIRVIFARSAAQALTRGNGRMAVVAASPADATVAIAELGDGVDLVIAAFNSPANVTISGSGDDLDRLRALLERRGVACRMLDLDYAFHNPRMDAIARPLLASLSGLAAAPAGRAVFVSTVTGTPLEGGALDAEYWWRNVREPVHFSDAVATLVDLGCRTFLEIGPTPVLQRFLRECLGACGISGNVLPTLQRNDGDPRRLEAAALRLQLLATTPRLAAYFPRPGRRLRLPNYPWQRERYWYQSTSEALRLIERQRVHPLLGWPIPNAELAWENRLDPAKQPWLADHDVGGATVFPAAGFVEMALAAAREWRGSTSVVVENLDIVAPLVFDDERGQSVRLRIDPRGGDLRIESRAHLATDAWTLHATARVRGTSGALPFARIEPLAAQGHRIGRDIHYALAASLGLDYGPAFEGLREALVADHRCEALLDLPASLMLDGYLLHPAQVDVCFQVIIDLLADEIVAGRGSAFLPVRIARFDMLRPGRIARLRCVLRRASARSVLADFEMLGADGAMLARATGCRLRAAALQLHRAAEPARWRLLPWLMPHPATDARTALPAPTELTDRARAVLGEIAAERETWFTQTLPLVEALSLSFAAEAFQVLARRDPAGWRASLSGPFARWLDALAVKEGLLNPDRASPALLADSQLPPAEELWREILRLSPVCMPQLALMGVVGRRLPELLRDGDDGAALAIRLEASPLAEAMLDEHPAYSGLGRALEAMLLRIAADWPASRRRLRVLEISTTPTRLACMLADALPADALDYVLAVPAHDGQHRQGIEDRARPGIVLAGFDPLSWTLSADARLPDVFDVVILRHCLHRSANPRPAISRTRGWLAPGAMLVVAEQFADWSADFLAGVDPGWWRGVSPLDAPPSSSLKPPEHWQRILAAAGLVDCDIFLEPAGAAVAGGAYLVLGRRKPDEATLPAAAASARWLLRVDEASTPLAEQLRRRFLAQGQHVVLAGPGDAADLHIAAMDHVVHLRGWAAPPGRTAEFVEALLDDVRALSAKPGAKRRLWVVTRGGALASGLPQTHPASPGQAALWGSARVVMNEHPELGTRLIDLADDDGPADVIARLADELLHPDETDEIVLSDAARHGLTLRADSNEGHHQDGSRFRLDFKVPGQLRNLAWVPDRESALAPDEIEIGVRTTGLNFRDVMYAMGLLPDEAVEEGFAGASLGLECAGTITRVGVGVKDLAPGDAVMGFGRACFASHVTTRADAVTPIPPGWSFEEAATVPTAFFTAFYALAHLARVRPGELVLIHGAAGGVGLAAIQVARHLGARIIATAGSEEKRRVAELMGAERVFDSRSLSFADDIRTATAGSGVDVVLNSLSGDAMRRSIELLRPFGRFLELGKRDFYENTSLGLRPLKDNISYFAIDADRLLVAQPELAARLMREVMALFRDGRASPLPFRCFSADRAIDAFRAMQQSRHIGKLVVTLDRRPPPLRSPVPRAPGELDGTWPEGTWLVTGGLSGFGLESARWLVSRGVRSLMLVGRRGLATPGAREAIAGLMESGADVRAEACDIADAAAVARLVESVGSTMKPLAGVLHAAAVFDDRPIARLDAAGVERVVSAKLMGGWNLHQATRDLPLRHFVLYSSIAVAIGNPGQANYVAANAGLEGLAVLRQRMGLPATCIAWGPIADVGYLARNKAVKSALEQRLGRAPMPAATALATLDDALGAAPGTLAVADFDWVTLGRILPSAHATRFAALAGMVGRDEPGAGGQDIDALIAGKSIAEVTAILRPMVAEEVARILATDATRIDAAQPLLDLGLDSLMAVELALGLEQRFGIRLPAMMINEAPTVERVAGRIARMIAGETEASGDAVGEPEDVAAVIDLARRHGENLEPHDIDGLLEDARRLSAIGGRVAP
jgi:acyl transferase domain-containing protein/acyl carrier protein